jgi:hypothetical protein
MPSLSARAASKVDRLVDRGVVRQERLGRSAQVPYLADAGASASGSGGRRLARGGRGQDGNGNTAGSAKGGQTHAR